MSNSNNRHNLPDTLHHLTSRIAHRVYFLKDDERNDLMEIVCRAAEFTGVKLVGWCIMTNHFHLLVYLPERQPVDEEEVLRRYGVLKGAAAARDMAMSFAKWRAAGASGEDSVVRWLDDQRRRMYDIGSFMKIVKQWFTEDYNSRNSHKGTLWEAAYHDRVVPLSSPKMAECLAYIHLNPIRAAVADRFDGYLWSSYTAFRRGDLLAKDGMRFVYGNEMSDAEMCRAHEELLVSILEYEKLLRAEEISRMRKAGYEMPADALTSEALVVQASAQLDEIRAESLRLREQRDCTIRSSERASAREKEILLALKTLSSTQTESISEAVGIPLRTVYRALKSLEAKGFVRKEGHGGSWKIGKTGLTYFAKQGQEG